MELTSIDLHEYIAIVSKQKLTLQDKSKLAKYPYVSLVTYCKEKIYSFEYNDLRRLEDENIWQFLRISGILFGVGSKAEIEQLHKCLMYEPLRSAVIAARQVTNSEERTIVFIEKACKILLSIDKRGTTMMNAINVGLYGKMPFRFSSILCEMGNEWFANFLEYKLQAMRKVFLQFGAENAYSFLVASIMYSLYCFAPGRFHIKYCTSENEALHKILHEFSDIINNYKL